MVGKTRIVAIGAGGDAQGDGLDQVQDGESAALALEESWVEQAWDAEEEAPAPKRSGWVIPAMAIALVIGWTGFFGWLKLPEALAGAAPARWADWITAWSTPTLLVGVAWLLIMRSSTREASRFGDTARLLRDESIALESRLGTVNQELSLAREFIAAQSRDLETLGRMAAERLSQHADRLQSLIQGNSAQITSIGDVSEAALDNMEKLRGSLPVIANSAKDVTNNIGNAGRAAQAQLQEMIAGFHRLNEFGSASERQVATLRGKVDEALAAFSAQAGQLDEIGSARFAALAERSAEFRSQLDGHEVEALAAVRARAAALGTELEATRSQLDEQEAGSITSLRARLAALRDEGVNIARSLRDGEAKAVEAWRDGLKALDADMREAITTLEKVDRQAMETARARLTALVEEAHRLDQGLVDRNRQFDEEMARRRSEADEREAAAAQAMAERLGALDSEVASRRETQAEHDALMLAHADKIAAQLEAFEARMAAVVAQGRAAEASVAASLQVLADKLTTSKQALAGTEKNVAELTDSSVRLLELIQASATHSREDLITAIATGEERLTALETRALSLRDTVKEAGIGSESLSGYVMASRDGLTQVQHLSASIDTRFAAQQDALAELQRSLAAIDNESGALAEKAQGELRGAIEALSGSARDAIAGIETMSAAAVSALAERLGAESGDAIDRAMRSRAVDVAGQLEQSAAHAAGVSREAAIHLRDQLTKVDELAGNLERRVAQVRQRAEEQVDGDFARRVALITEALNSNAIDIARAMDVDVADTAWASYLKGDRGIFTRRAVKLLDAAEARSIAQIYEDDRSFRDHVSRYIHDFEAMLRQLLSTRDGHALGVTLLSSDMGKLYVALAQAIERLRT